MSEAPDQAPDQAKVAIVGGGVIGLSLAYHLGKRGCSDVLLLERNELTSGTSWHAAGIVGPLRASLNLTRLSIYATELFGRLEEETGQATGYRRTGGLWLAQTQDRLTELARIAAMGEMTGLDARIVSAAEVGDKLPLLRTDDLAGALWVGEDGQVNPVDLCMAYAKGARSAGVRIRERAAVTAIEKESGAGFTLTLADGSYVQAEAVANCAGVWARQVGALAGVPVPVQAVEHMYVVTEAIAGLPAPCPIVRDLDGGIYVKEDAGKLVLGGFEPDAKPWDAGGLSGDTPFLMLPEDWDQFEPFLTAGLNRLPVLEQTGIQHFMNGPEGFTPDTKQVMGEAPNLKNFYVAAGFNRRRVQLDRHRLLGRRRQGARRMDRRRRAADGPLGSRHRPLRALRREPPIPHRAGPRGGRQPVRHALAPQAAEDRPRCEALAAPRGLRGPGCGVRRPGGLGAAPMVRDDGGRGRGPLQHWRPALVALCRAGGCRARRKRRPVRAHAIYEDPPARY
jgi:glycine/D-amino acid oxidase-like deaminating enzyme